ncbi:M23 family metallopeptidase [Roseisalinus antarcticus]|uniref:Murein DD-endopeptidase MepM n=1 Tax=Roseisalinus antarcticus TaxID=254357 RepID=A0A1Y5TRL5_9RHOB|nr:M23 family metallopeptidase [Roseisalinus antarcticus]SLN69890.1 Murein DD-endopeptidase MepM [Roseisalinus antarcticus]
MRRVLIALLLTPSLGQAEEFLLSLPVECELGENCHIQQYTDRDPGPDAVDFTCGPLTYDGHKGTDFALPSQAAMADGVTVLAAAPGVVRGTRDGMEDIAQGTPGAPDVSGRECGNGLIIDHGDGWETQYCHMRQGSVAVASGETVNAGTPLGLIGLSGQTEFPHLHLSVRKNGAVIDPFDTGDGSSCGDTPFSLWADRLTYAPGGLLSVGWAAGVPPYAEVKAGTADDRNVSPNGPALVLWAFAFGGRDGDTLRLAFNGPRGENFQTEDTLTRNMALFTRSGGRRTPPDGWPPGRYEGTVELLRNGTLIDRMETEITLR